MAVVLVGPKKLESIWTLGSKLAKSLIELYPHFGKRGSFSLSQGGTGFPPSSALLRANSRYKSVKNANQSQMCESMRSTTWLAPKVGQGAAISRLSRLKIHRNCHNSLLVSILNLCPDDQ